MIMKHLLLASVIAVVGLSIAGCAEAMTTASSPRDKRSPDDGNSMCGPPNGPPCGPPPNLPSFDSIANGAKDMVVASASSMAGGRSKRAPQQGGQGGGGMGGMPGMGGGMDPGSIAGDMGNMAKRVGNMFG